MQIVIDIDENVFTRLFDNGIEDYEIVNDDLFAVAKSIRKGTPLPKGHGRLIDGDVDEQRIKEVANRLDVWLYEAQTIIEADKEQKE